MNELQVSAVTGAVIYGLVVSDAGLIWNTGTSALEALNAAHYANYAVSIPESVILGLYFGNMPAAPGSPSPYSITYRLQQGGSPDPTDPTIGSTTLSWTGTAEAGITGVQFDLTQTIPVSPAPAVGSVAWALAWAAAMLGADEVRVNDQTVQILASDKSTVLGTITYTNTINAPTHRTVAP